MSMTVETTTFVTISFDAYHSMKKENAELREALRDYETRARRSAESAKYWEQSSDSWRKLYEDTAFHEEECDIEFDISDRNIEDILEELYRRVEALEKWQGK